jgi:mannose-6-phosphate isomerase-like protein (cupin superfamily)
MRGRGLLSPRRGKTIPDEEASMADVKAKTIDQIPYYQGPNAIPGIRFHSAGRELGVSAWGMNVLEIDAGCVAYPEHDHVKDGQEEVYVVLKGSGTIDAGGERTELAEGMLVRVGPSTRRKISPGAGGIVVLAIGATPGQAYSMR